MPQTTPSLPPPGGGKGTNALLLRAGWILKRDPPGWGGFGGNWGLGQCPEPDRTSGVPPGTPPPEASPRRAETPDRFAGAVYLRTGGVHGAQEDGWGARSPSPPPRKASPLSLPRPQGGYC